MKDISLFKKLELDVLKKIIVSIRLGPIHLKNKLTTQQWKNLLKRQELNKQEYKRLTDTIIEKIGQSSLVLNTIITSVFGAWMGFHAFTDSKIDSIFQLALVTSLTFILSAIFAFFSFKFIKSNASAAMDKQKLLNLEQEIIELIRTKNEIECNHLIKNTNQHLQLLLKRADKLTFSHNLQKIKGYIDVCKNFKQLLKVISTIEQVFTKKSYYRIFDSKLTILRADFTDYIATISNEEENLSELKGKETQLIDALLNSKRPDLPKFNFFHWIKKNYLLIIVGLFPTLFGCFASMFVFLSGGPDLVKALGFWSLFQSIKHPTAQLFEFLIAVTMTIFYGFSFVYNNYKLYIRQTQEEKTNKIITDIEHQNTIIENELIILTQIQSYIIAFEDLFGVLEKLSTSSPVKSN